jgi:hypothetical protein
MCFPSLNNVTQNHLLIVIHGRNCICNLMVVGTAAWMACACVQPREKSRVHLQHGLTNLSNYSGRLNHEKLQKSG